MAFDIKPLNNKASKFDALRAAVTAAIPISSETAISKEIRHADPATCTERIRIIFDDSGSMEGAKLTGAKSGVIEFLRNCIPGQTAVAVHLMNANSQREIDPLLKRGTLSSDLIQIASAVDSPALRASGGTSLFPTLLEALRANPRATRLIAFSDGTPDNYVDKELVYKLSQEYNIPIDTAYISGRGASYTNYEDPAALLMREIAECTGGIFLNLSDGASFKTAFKYLAPPQRLRLMDGTFRASVEGGKG